MDLLMIAKPLVVLGLGASLSLVSSDSLHAKDRAWQRGHWRDTADERVSGGAVAVPLSGTPGQAPTVVAVPLDDTWQSVTIDGPDHMTYVAKRRIVRHGLKRHQAFVLVVNDPVTFAIDGSVLYVRGVDPDDPSYEYRFDIVKRTRQP